MGRNIMPDENEDIASPSLWDKITDWFFFIFMTIIVIAAVFGGLWYILHSVLENLNVPG